MKHQGAAGVVLASVFGAMALSVLAAGAPVAPVVDAQTGYLLGGSRNGKWIDDKETARAIQGGESFRVYSSHSKLGDTTGSKTRTGEAPCDATHWVTLKRNYNGVLAVGGKWNALPRRYRAQDTSQKVYRDDVARILRERGIKNPKVTISQLWRIDLEGDGIEEVLLSATNYKGLKAGQYGISSSAQAGEYSMVLLRKVVRGKAQTTLLAGEVYARAKVFNAPNAYSLAGVYDLNGDGKMEIVLRSSYYEGGSTSVFEVQGATPKEVISSGCGA